MTDEKKADILFNIMMQFPDRAYLDPSNSSGYNCNAKPDECHECPFTGICSSDLDVNVVFLMKRKYPELLV